MSRARPTTQSSIITRKRVAAQRAHPGVEIKLMPRFSDARGLLAIRRVLGSQASHGGGQEVDGEDDEPWLTSKEVNAARLSCKAIVASIVGKIHGKDAIEGLITSVGASEAISLLTCLRKVCTTLRS